MNCSTNGESAIFERPLSMGKVTDVYLLQGGQTEVLHGDLPVDIRLLRDSHMVMKPIRNLIHCNAQNFDKIGEVCRNLGTKSPECERSRYLRD